MSCDVTDLVLPPSGDGSDQDMTSVNLLSELDEGGEREEERLSTVCLNE